MHVHTLSSLTVSYCWCAYSERSLVLAVKSIDEFSDSAGFLDKTDPFVTLQLFSETDKTFSAREKTTTKNNGVCGRM
jgi:hypothetical protein